MSMNVQTQGSSIYSVSVNLKPSRAKLDKIDSLKMAIDTLIVQNGFRDENIMKPKSETVLFWDWTIVTVGTYTFPAPIHTISKKRSVLFNWNDSPVELSNEECAYVTAIYYLEMLCMITNDWDKVRDLLPPIFRMLMSGGIDWMSALSPQDYQDIVFALKEKLSPDGHYVLN